MAAYGFGCPDKRIWNAKCYACKDIGCAFCPLFPGTETAPAARLTLRFLSPYSPCREPNLRTRYPYNLIENRSFLRLPGESNEMYLPCISPPSFCFCSVPTAGKWELNPLSAAVRYASFALVITSKTEKKPTRGSASLIIILLFKNSCHHGTNFSAEKCAPISMLPFINSCQLGTNYLCRKCGTTCPTLCAHTV